MLRSRRRFRSGRRAKRRDQSKRRRMTRFKVHSQPALTLTSAIVPLCQGSPSVPAWILLGVRLWMEMREMRELCRKRVVACWRLVRSSPTQPQAQAQSQEESSPSRMRSVAPALAPGGMHLGFQGEVQCITGELHMGPDQGSGAK